MKKKWFHVSKRSLILIAGLVWLAAGVNILLIGAPDFAAAWGGQALFALGAAAVFGIFAGLIFVPLVRKHTLRIASIAEPAVPAYRFFDGKSYAIMAFMMGGGILLRTSHVAPPIFIGVMYLGIGAALALAGVLFLRRYCVWDVVEA